MVAGWNLGDVLNTDAYTDEEYEAKFGINRDWMTAGAMKGGRHVPADRLIRGLEREYGVNPDWFVNGTERNGKHISAEKITLAMDRALPGNPWTAGVRKQSRAYINTLSGYESRMKQLGDQMKSYFDGGAAQTGARKNDDNHKAKLRSWEDEIYDIQMNVREISEKIRGMNRAYFAEGTADRLDEWTGAMKKARESLASGLSENPALIYKTLNPMEYVVSDDDFEEYAAKEVRLPSYYFKKNSPTYNMQINMGNDITYISPEEQKVYSYYYNKYGQKKAQQYFESLENDIVTRNGHRIAGKINGNPVAEALYSSVAGMDASVDGLLNAALVITGQEPLRPQSYQAASQMIMADDKGAQKFLNRAANAIGGMVPALIAGGLAGPGAAAVVTGISSGGNAAAYAMNEGHDRATAILYGAAAGALEGAMQYTMSGIKMFSGNVLGKLPGSGLLKGRIASAMPNAVKTVMSKPLAKAAASYFAGMGKEGIEEYIQRVLEPVLKNIVLGEQNEVRLLSGEALEAGLVGALTAGFLNVPAAVQSVNLGINLFNPNVAQAAMYLPAEVIKTLPDSVLRSFDARMDASEGAKRAAQVMTEYGPAADVDIENVGRAVDILARNVQIYTEPSAGIEAKVNTEVDARDVQGVSMADVASTVKLMDTWNKSFKEGTQLSDGLKLTPYGDILGKSTKGVEKAFDSDNALMLSTRFLNKADPMWKNSENIKSISGYQDIVCHGDKMGFSYLDLNGNEINMTPHEFAVILKNSPVYEGRPIRLVSCEAGADGSITAQYMANQLGVPVLAPTDIVYVYPDGVMKVGKYNTGRWILFKPKER